MGPDASSVGDVTTARVDHLGWRRGGGLRRARPLTLVSHALGQRVAAPQAAAGTNLNAPPPVDAQPEPPAP
ncbi:hypothetical protein, partial [Nocardia abscessus]|uniref:hypothetical protein n=1 Tax=Nocardia abscessus TaxID=120957 RepID=UPI00245688BC